jgi:hypothetical protein
MRPPLLPAEILRRVIKLSRLNGWSVVIIAGACALGSLAFGDFPGALVGLLVTLGGAMEVRGCRMLQGSDARGMRWLVRSQLVVLAAIWAYALWCLGSYNDQALRSGLTPKMRTTVGELGFTVDEILPLARQLDRILYGSVMAAALIYQGGMVLHYHRRARAVETALAPPPATSQNG